MSTVSAYPTFTLGRFYAGRNRNNDLVWSLSCYTDEATYVMEIDNDGAGHLTDFTFIAWRDGDEFEFRTDDAFEANVEAFIDNEYKGKDGKPVQHGFDADVELFTEGEATAYLNEHHDRWSFSQGRVLGFNVAIFDKMAEYWKGLQAVGIHFSLT